MSSFTISYLHYQIPYSFGAAASTRTSNELGSGKPEAVRATVNAVLAMSIVEGLIASIGTLICGHLLGYAFSEEEEVTRYVSNGTFSCHLHRHGWPTVRSFSGLRDGMAAYRILREPRGILSGLHPSSFTPGICSAP